ncbi:hypothetical protein OsI_16502 [Oryza sativa Indica Group]|uniref:Uncharacterized protein n=1 Tax=Oryza sativa subsp. indica TaxID=39946 RepID=B8AR98_ORYSI|nr:hypothetical protein OsI_16502 [Oryza sativa Indica Group]
MERKQEREEEGINHLIPETPTESTRTRQGTDAEEHGNVDLVQQGDHRRPSGSMSTTPSAGKAMVAQGWSCGTASFDQIKEQVNVFSTLQSFFLPIRPHAFRASHRAMSGKPAPRRRATSKFEIDLNTLSNSPASAICEAVDAPSVGAAMAARQLPSIRH